MNHRYSPLTAAILSALAASAQAQTAAEEAPATLPTVTVQGSAIVDDSYAPAPDTIGGRLPATLKDTPQTVTVVNKSVLDDQAATSLVEALRNVPGITISAGEGGQIGDNINLRGFSARTDLFVDGFRDRGQYSRDVFALDAVEVLKGPASMLFGRGSTGGVINQVSKRPHLKDQSEISASVGTDDYYRATYDSNKKLSDHAAVRLAAFWQDVSFERDKAEKQNFGLAPSLRFGIGQPTEVTVSALIQRNSEVPDYGGPLLRGNNYSLKSTAKPLDIGNHHYGFATDHFDQDIDSFSVAIQHKFNDSLTLRNRTNYSRVNINAAPTPLSSVDVIAGACDNKFGGTAYRFVPLSCLQAKGSDRDRDVIDTSLYNQTDLIARFGTGPIKHTLIGGVEVGRETFDFQRFVWSPTGPVVLLDRSNTAPRPGTGTLGQISETEARSEAVYLNDQLDLGEQWKLVAGARFDRFEARTRNQVFPTTPPVSTNPILPVLSNNDDMLSMRGGLIYQPSPAQSYYASYGTSFNPSAETLALSTSNEQLDPEKNRSYEVGAKWSLMDEALLLNAALFRVEKHHARTTDPVTDEVSLDGDIRVEGVELAATGQINPDWQIIGGYTFLNSEVRDSRDVTEIDVNGTDVEVKSKGKDYQNTPRHSATLWSTYRVTPEWQVGAGASGTTSRFVNNFESAEIDGYVRGDAMVAYLQPSYDVRLNVQNLTDELYYETASSGRATAAMGRRFILTGTYRF
jgi:catecholate siderophore receptor